MGKISKRQPAKHSNHHDNPRRSKKSVVRRQHSQNVPEKSHVKTSGKATQSAHRLKNQHGNGSYPAKLKVPFSRWDQVLLVGEGDFSFTLSMAQNYGVESIVSTCFDTEEVLQQKYPNAAKTVSMLYTNESRAHSAIKGSRSLTTGASNGEEEWDGFSPSASSSNEAEGKPTAPNLIASNITVLYGVDATKLSSTHKKSLRQHLPFTKIVFNFPHVGGLSTDVNRQVRANQQLLVDFFGAAKSMLATETNPARSRSVYVSDAADGEGDSENDVNTIDLHGERLKHGQLLVTLFEGEPYTLWNIRDLARHSGLKVLESFKFPWAAYPGYQHARTIGDITIGKDRSDEGKRKGAWRGEERDARCYVLALKDDDDGRPAPGSKKRKMTEDADDSD